MTTGKLIPRIELPERRRLAGGTTLLSKTVTHNNVAALQLYLPGGSRGETVADAGLTTLAMRMLLRGTPRRTSHEIAVAFSCLGASVHADCNSNSCIIGLVAMTDFFEPSLDLLLEVLREASFPEERFLVERETQCKDLREEYDHLPSATFKLFQRTFFGDHHYGLPTTGLEESVSSLTREVAAARYKEVVNRPPVVAGLAGQIDPDWLARKLEAGLPVEQTPNGQPLPPLATPPPHGAQAQLTRESAAEFLVVGYPFPAIDTPDFVTAKVLDCVLGGSMDSRLFTNLRDKQGLAYQVGSSYAGLLQYAFLAGFIGTHPSNHQKALAGIKAEMERLRQEPVPADELERAKTYLVGTYIMSLERNSDVAGLFARYEAYGLGMEFAAQYPECVHAVTAGQVQALAQRWLENPTVVHGGPEG